MCTQEMRGLNSEICHKLPKQTEPPNKISTNKGGVPGNEMAEMRGAHGHKPPYTQEYKTGNWMPFHKIGIWMLFGVAGQDQPLGIS